MQPPPLEDEDADRQLAQLSQGSGGGGNAMLGSPGMSSMGNSAQSQVQSQMSGVAGMGNIPMGPVTNVGSWGMGGPGGSGALLSPSMSTQPAVVPNVQRKLYTIQRVNGTGAGGGAEGSMPGPHQHTLEQSDRVKRNSVVRWVEAREKEKKKAQVCEALFMVKQKSLLLLFFARCGEVGLHVARCVREINMHR